MIKHKTDVLQITHQNGIESHSRLVKRVVYIRENGTMYVRDSNGQNRVYKRDDGQLVTEYHFWTISRLQRREL